MKFNQNKISNLKKELFALPVKNKLEDKPEEEATLEQSEFNKLPETISAKQQKKPERTIDSSND